MENIKELVHKIIRETCTHWICADEEELERVETELEQKIKALISSNGVVGECSHENSKLNIVVCSSGLNEKI